MSVGVRAPAGAGTRLRVQRVLGGAALEPPGLPPAAVLVVRSLADPLPGRLAPRPGDVRAPAEWESAVRGALAEQWRGAARPARGPVPAGASAVYFADTAEMIAAFARDAAAGDVARWWWRAVLKGLPGGPVAALTALWAREARHLPAAVEQLAATGDAARVLASIPAPQVARLLAAVAWAWDAPGLLAAPPSSGEVDAGNSTTLTTIGADDADPSRRSSVERASADRSRTTVAPPWTGFLPVDAVPAGLAPEPAALLGLSLMLSRAPHVARGRDFVARFVRWRAAGSASPAARPSPAPSPFNAPRGTSSIPSARSDGHTPAEAASERRAEEGRMDGDAADRPSASIEVFADRDATDAEDARSATRLPPAAARQVEPATANVTGPIDGSRTIAPSGIDGSESDTADGGGWEVRIHEAPPEEARAASGACGVFYLVNVLRSLGFHRALDEHFHLPPVVGGWGWIELVARALLGPAAGGLADDPIWRLLAELDGRAPDEPVGGGFLPPRTEQLPAAWIDLFRGDPPPPSPSLLLGMDVGEELQRFLDLVVPVLRGRIAGALGGAGGDPEERLETALIRRMGTIEATRTHVDVRMGMDQATLPVRLAGLDATPGWVPELARVVTFHFV